jgi:lipopolysaccharide heptosyltransferase II
MPEQPLRRILVVRLDNIGDVVMLTPALRALRSAYPAARIALLCSQAGGRVAPLLPWIDDVIVHRAIWQETSGQAFDAHAEVSFIRSLAARRFDAAFIFTSFSQSPFPPAYACHLAGIPRRFGESKEFGGNVLTLAAPPLPDHVHQVDRNVHLLRAAGVPLAGTHLELHVPPADVRRARTLLLAHGIDAAAPYVVVAPGASCDARRYPAERYAAVAHLLARQSSFPVVVVGADADVPAAELILDVLPPGAGVSLAGRTSIPELAAVIRDAALVVTNNSGPLHLADAFRRPVVVLYAGTEYEEQWRPRFAPSVLLRRPTDCSPCFAFICPYDKQCLDIEPAAVVEAALSLLGGILSPAPYSTRHEEVVSP